MTEADRILNQIAKERGCERRELGRGARGFRNRATSEALYRLFRETDMPATLIARKLGFACWRSARDRALSFARSKGEDYRTLADLRGNGSAEPRAVDWTALALRLAGWRETRGVTKEAAARKAGVCPKTWRRAEEAHPIDADSFALLLAKTGIAMPSVLVPALRVSHEPQREKEVLNA